MLIEEIMTIKLLLHYTWNIQGKTKSANVKTDQYVYIKRIYYELRNIHVVNSRDFI